MFVRIKRIKGHEYAYAVENSWTKKGSRQKVAKYLGRVSVVRQAKSDSFEDVHKASPKDLCSYDLIRAAVALELHNHGFVQIKNKWQLDTFSVDLALGRVRNHKEKAVLKLNEDFLSDYTLRRLLFFRSIGDRKEVAVSLAKAFIQAGIPVRNDIFINVFDKVYRPGQSMVTKSARKVVIVTGTPGAGKTTVARKIEKLGFSYIDVGEIIDKENLAESFDDKRDCKVVDIGLLNRALVRVIDDTPGNLVIDSHLSHCLAKSRVDYCIVARCSIAELRARLEKRGYAQPKVLENVESEIFEICLEEAKEKGHNIIEFWTDKEDFGKISAILHSK